MAKLTDYESLDQYYDQEIDTGSIIEELKNKDIEQAFISKLQKIYEREKQKYNALGINGEKKLKGMKKFIDQHTQTLNTQNMPKMNTIWQETEKTLETQTELEEEINQTSTFPDLYTEIKNIQKQNLPDNITQKLIDNAENKKTNLITPIIDKYNEIEQIGLTPIIKQDYNNIRDLILKSELSKKALQLRGYTPEQAQKIRKLITQINRMKKTDKEILLSNI